MNPADRPQIGPLDVDRSALDAAGLPLVELLADLGAELADASPSDVPTTGWRVLGAGTNGSATIGAPADGTGQSWRMAHVPATPDGDLVRTISIHPETFPLRRSRAERARGLELRWPTLSESEAAGEVFAIDIVNTGRQRWRPDGDDMGVVGFIRSPGDQGGGASFGWFSGQHPGVPLDPGEYARVRVRIQGTRWHDLIPGPHELHAVHVGLSIPSPRPLPITVTQGMIDRHRRDSARPRSAADERREIESGLSHLRALLAARDRIQDVARAVTEGSSRDAVRVAVQQLLGLDAASADTVIGSPLDQLSRESLEQITRQVRDLEMRLAGLGDGQP